jgi:hypothetical protein
MLNDFEIQLYRANMKVYYESKDTASPEVRELKQKYTTPLFPIDMGSYFLGFDLMHNH